jgi:hypothetical protein
LSTLNPNAFYEIGIRHMAQKPVIHMQLAEDEIPFDISLYRAIKFSRRTPSDLRKARNELEAVVKAVLADDYEADNPVTRVRGRIELEAHATPREKVLIEQMKGFNRRLEEVERTTGLEPRNALLGSRRPNMRLEVDREQFSEQALQQTKDIVRSILSARYVEWEGGFVYAQAPERFLVNETRWEAAKRELLNIPGIKSVEHLYEREPRSS